MLRHKNADDEKDFKKHIDDLARHPGNLEAAVFNDNYDDGCIELDPKPDTIGELIQTWEKAAALVKGEASVVFANDSVTTNFKPVDFVLDVDDLVVIFDVDKKFEATVEDVTQMFKDAMSDFHLNGQAGYKFMFRGKEVDVESVALITHGEEDDDATFAVTFTDASVNSNRRKAGKILTVKDLVNAIHAFFKEQTITNDDYCMSMKVVAVLDGEDDDSGEQQVMQVVNPRAQGDQVVMDLLKCTDWRFKEFASDPESIDVAQLEKKLKALGKNNGYIFLKQHKKTYGIAGIDTLESGAPTNDGEAYEVLALMIKPWDQLFESNKGKNKKMKKRATKYTRRQILESIKYWQKQLKLGNYKKTFESRRVVERIEDDLNLIEKPMRRITNDNNGDVTVAELRDIADVVYDGQDNVPLNVGENGQIYGQVNQVLDVNGQCVLTLAPYRNGRRRKDLSIDGCVDEPLRLPKIMQILRFMPGNAKVVVKMKDPYGFGVSANAIVEQPIKMVDVDSVYGVFLRVDDEQL